MSEMNDDSEWINQLKALTKKSAEYEAQGGSYKNIHSDAMHRQYDRIFTREDAPDDGSDWLNQLASLTDPHALVTKIIENGGCPSEVFGNLINLKKEEAEKRHDWTEYDRIFPRGGLSHTEAEEK